MICHETDPSAITVSNDGFQSDSFSMVLDTYRTEQAGMVFGTNPVGAEYDGQVAGRNESPDWNWSTVWEVRTKTHDKGWSAEFAIPFQSLRYGKGEVHSWGVNFARIIRRHNEVSSSSRRGTPCRGTRRVDEGLQHPRALRSWVVSITAGASPVQHVPLVARGRHRRHQSTAPAGAISRSRPMRSVE